MHVRTRVYMYTQPPGPPRSESGARGQQAHTTHEGEWLNWDAVLLLSDPDGEELAIDIYPGVHVGRGRHGGTHRVRLPDCSAVGQFYAQFGPISVVASTFRQGPEAGMHIGPSRSVCMRSCRCSLEEK